MSYLEAEHSCIKGKEIVSYLEAEYSCIKGKYIMSYSFPKM